MTSVLVLSFYIDSQVDNVPLVVIGILFLVTATWIITLQQGVHIKSSFATVTGRGFASDRFSNDFGAFCTGIRSGWLDFF